VPRETGDASAVGAVPRWPGWVADAGPGLAVGDRPIVGNRAAALPAPMSVLDSPFKTGMGPSGSTAMGVALGEALADAFVDAETAVTAVVSAAAGGFHPVLVTLAVAVSVTELTAVAFDATAICAVRLAGWVVVTELMLHEMLPLPLAQPPLNTGFWLDGCAVNATHTPEADPFCVETCTV
jgi:hypothetical protein